MTGHDFEVNGRQFRDKTEYARAMRDAQTIAQIKKKIDFTDAAALERLLKEIEGKRIRFYTVLGKDFQEEVEKALQKARMDGYVQDALRKNEKRRKQMIALCSVVAAGCLIYVGVYSWYNQRTQNTYDEMSAIRESAAVASDVGDSKPSGAQYTLDEASGEREVLEEYKTLLNKNKKLIGWLKIDDTNIDYPVMQTSDNEYYLDHNLNQEYDKNGSIFMDKDCDAVNPSTNYILYGHHMKSGQMFGKLDDYESKSFYEKHKIIQFDTIYEKGTYEVMYVFRSHVYGETEVAFKYYQFIDANGEAEFDSAMNEMAAISLYDTGVTAVYGDHLLTLSTCDYQETNGRFVVVAKKIENKN